MSAQKNSISSKKDLRHSLESRIETLVSSVSPSAGKKSKKLVKKAARLLADGLYVKPEKKKTVKAVVKPKKKTAVRKKAAAK